VLLWTVAELLYERGGDYYYLKLSHIFPENVETYLIWAQESRELFSGNYDHFEITTTDEQKAYNLLLLLSESDTYKECLEKYAEENKNLILQKTETKLSDYENIIVYYYYVLR
jgi:hypothetical protein